MVGQIVKDPGYTDMHPVKCCAVCGYYDSPVRRNIIYSDGQFWLCPDCLNKLRNLIARESNNDLS